MSLTAARMVRGAGVAILLLGLACYAVLGTPLATFHPDEAMQISASADWDILTGAQGPWALTTRPPYVVDSEAQLRILNGTLHRHFVGLLRGLAGIGPDLLPPRPGWDWARGLAENEAAGFVPRPELLFLGRAASVMFLAAAVVPAWLLGRLMAGRLGAGIFTTLLMLNPVVLLNGRRALQEGSMLFFGLLSVLAAFQIARRLSVGRSGGWMWLCFAVASGLAVAAKHPGALFVAGGAAAIATAALAAPAPRPRALDLGALAVALAGAGAVFVVLSPALWDQPWTRLSDAVRVRSELIGLIDDGMHRGTGQRMWRVATMPFAEPLQHFEMADWARTPGLGGFIARYHLSGLAGLPIGGVAGWAATFLAVLGLAASVAGGTGASQVVLRRGAVAWWTVTAVVLLGNPLAWQRYYLPLVPPSAMLATLGLLWAAGWLRRKLPRQSPKGIPSS